MHSLANLAHPILHFDLNGLKSPVGFGFLISHELAAQLRISSSVSRYALLLYWSSLVCG